MLAPALFRRRLWASLICKEYCGNEGKVPLDSASGCCARTPIVPFAKHSAVTGLITLMLTLAMSEAGAKASRSVADRGETNYATYCSPCHGAQGNGDGPMAALLNPKPARHGDADYMKTLSDDYMYRVIRDGGPAVGKSPMMAPWKATLSDPQIRDLVAYIRSLAK